MIGNSGRTDGRTILLVQKYTTIAARWIFGLWYFITGGAWLLTHASGHGAAHLEVTAGAIAFQKALTASRFMDPLLAFACFFGGGGWMTVDRCYMSISRKTTSVYAVHSPMHVVTVRPVRMRLGIFFARLTIIVALQ